MSVVELIRRSLTQLGMLAAHPAAFLAVAVFAGIWYAIDRQSLDMHGVATLVTLVIALLIQRAEHRDTQAIHAKLDALIEALPAVSNAVAQIDRREPEDIERQREVKPSDT
jgi:low affinity Fe/Cu permease